MKFGVKNILRCEYSQFLLHFSDNLVIIGGFVRGVLSDIEALSLDKDNINCDPTDLQYKVCSHASAYTPILNGFLTCGGIDENYNYLSKCILQRKENYSN